MRKLFKKALACCLVAALALTCFVGALSVNAETYAGTIVAGEIEVAADATTAVVPVVINADAALNAAKITVAAEGWTVSSIAVDAASTAAKIDAENINGATFLIEAVDNTAGFTTATVNVTLTAEAAVAADVVITLDEVHAATWNEDVVNLAITDGAITVKAAVVEPTPIEAKLLAHNLLLTEAVGSRISVNVSAKNGLTTLGYTDYYLVIDYQLYDDSYNLTTDTITYNSDEYAFQNTAGTVDYFDFTSIALFEMPLTYDVYLYLITDGVTVAYVKETTSITTQALAYAQKYSTDIPLLKTLADMVNYGAAAQEFFAAQNAGSDICDAELPTVGFEDYQTYASTVDDLPESFNTTNTVKNPTKHVETSTMKAAATVLISSSTSIRFQFLAPGYDISKVTAKISYTDGYGDPVVADVALADITPTVSGSNTIYPYLFAKLALYDLDETVHVSLYNDGVEEISFDYSAGNFVNQYIGNATYTNILTAMELFAQSAKAKLVG